jgi:DNA-binding transcriptional LysR family regulator
MFDSAQIRTFITVAQTGSFSEAARRLGLGQPAVSQHIRKLETAAGKRLLDRDTHSVSLTADGEAMLGFAQSILDANERARRHFDGTQLRGKLRFGVSEDFVQSRLPIVLREFREQHPSVDLEITVALSGTLFERLANFELDLVLAKRRLGNEHGQFLSRERLVWVARDPGIIIADRPLPLIMFPRPSVTRAAAIEALDAAGRSWSIVCTCASLSGLHAAALAGFGIMVQPEGMIPSGLTPLASASGLPELSQIEFVLVGSATRRNVPASELAKDIAANFKQLRK